MKTTCVLLVLVSMIACVISAGTYCQRDGDCNCPSYETGYCGVPIQSGLIHGGHIGHRCHCLALLSHCPGACSSLTCGSHTILGHTIHTDKACVDKHCLCLMRPH